jgi:hypothetical protein
MGYQIVSYYTKRPHGNNQTQLPELQYEDKQVTLLEFRHELIKLHLPPNVIVTCPQTTKPHTTMHV